MPTKREPSALKLWESVDLFPNRVLLPFLSSFDGGNQRNAWDLEGATMEERE
jgi:hypothetical protein